MPGSIEQYLREVASLSGHELKTDVVVFRASASAADPSVITYTTPPTPGNQRTLRHKNHDYFFTELRVGVTTAADLDDIDLLRINFQRIGATDNLFSSDLELNNLVATQSGEAVPLPIGIKLPGGIDLEFILTHRGGTAIGTLRVVTAQLSAILIPKDFQLHGRR